VARRRNVCVTEVKERMLRIIPVSLKRTVSNVGALVFRLRLVRLGANALHTDLLRDSGKEVELEVAERIVIGLLLCCYCVVLVLLLCCYCVVISG